MEAVHDSLIWIAIAIALAGWWISDKIDDVAIAIKEVNDPPEEDE